MIAEVVALLDSLGVSMNIVGTQQMMFAWTLKAIIILSVLFVVKKVDRFIVNSIHYFDREVQRLDDHTERILDKSLCYFVDFIAFLFILSLLDLRGALMTLLAGAGVFGLAIGFASKDVAANMISGLFIHFDRPFRIGDDIQVQSFRGVVKELTFRSTVLVSRDKKRITIPNQILAQSAIINFKRPK